MEKKSKIDPGIVSAERRATRDGAALQTSAPNDASGTPISSTSATDTGAGSATNGPTGDSATSAFTIGGTKKRGRPKGSKNRPKDGTPQTSGAKAAQAIHLDNGAIAALLLSLHAAIAGVTKLPELALSEPEASALSSAAIEVANLYNLSADPRLIAWSNLTMVAAMVYGTRFMAIRERQRKEHESRHAKVSPINPNAPYKAPL